MGDGSANSIKDKTERSCLRRLVPENASKQINNRELVKTASKPRLSRSGPHLAVTCSLGIVFFTRCACLCMRDLV